MQERERGERKGRERVIGKSGEGTSASFITWARVGLADEAGADAMPNAAGGEGGHGSLNRIA